MSDATGTMRDARADDLLLLANDTRGTPSNAKVLELPPDEFFYFKAFRTGIADLTKDLPIFFYGMTLVHAWGLFEHYLGSLLRRILLARPEMLGPTRQLTLGEVLEHRSKDSLLASVAEQKVRSLFYQPARNWLRTLRSRYGLKGLTSVHDGDLIERSLVRNCVAHNRGLADGKLEKQTGGKYKQGVPIGISREYVVAAIDILRRFATAVEGAAVEAHPNALDNE